MNEENYTIRPYKPGDEIYINESFNEVFGTKRSIEEWYWKFQIDQNGSIIMLALNEEGKVLAQYAGIKVLLQIDDKIDIYILVVDSYALKTREVLRNRIFLKTYEKYWDNFAGLELDKFPWHYGSNAGRIQKLARLKMNATEPVPTSYLFQETNILIRPFGMIFGHIIWNWHLRCSKNINLDDVDDLWRRSSERYPVAVLRDSNYIRRRYLSHPTNKYMLIPVYEEGIMRGLGILILKNRLMKWVDLIWDGKDSKTIRKLKKLAWNFSLSSAAIKLEMWLSNDDIAKGILIEEGLMIGQDPYDLYLTSRSFSPQLDGHELTRRLYFTMGDSDMF
ncbi:MAG: hypothetical protein WBB48_12265 [Thermodesulfobacteriota bacterium]